MKLQLQNVILSALVLLCQDVQCCPDGWTEAGSLCLTFHEESRDWDGASQVCSSMQGHLVKVKDATDNEAVVNFRLSQTRGNPVWLGMRGSGGSWQWYDGTPVTWTPWDKGEEPADNGAGQCATLEDNGSTAFWSSKICLMYVSFICQYDPQPVTIIPMEKHQKWSLERKGRYSGPSRLVTVAAPSRIKCVVQCQSTESCDAIGYHRGTDTCHLITGGISANQVTASDDWELWFQNK